MNDRSYSDEDLGDLSLDDIEADLGTPQKGSGPSKKKARPSPKPRGAKKTRRFTFLLVGVILGVAGTILLPPLLRPYLPESLRGRSETVSGPVLAIEREESDEGDRLLLTVRGQQGATLATFSERVSEIALLVEVGDTVTLGVRRYEAFVENPSIQGVRKGAGVRPDRPTAEGEPAGEPGGAAEGEGEAASDVAGPAGSDTVAGAASDTVRRNEAADRDTGTAAADTTASTGIRLDS